MTFTINGKTVEIRGEAAILVHILEQEGIDPETARGVAVAVNDRVVRRTAWSEAEIQLGDRVEIVTARQGG